MNVNLKVRQVSINDLLAVTSYIGEAKRELFPNSTKEIDPIETFKKVYLVGDKAKFFIAVDEFDTIHGTIGMVPYNNRFIKVKYFNKKVFEVVKLYVNKNDRRLGLGMMLVNYLQEAAINSQCDVLYLHTHPFLVGAVEFWKKNNFKVIDQEDIMRMTTIHMEKVISQLH